MWVRCFGWVERERNLHLPEAQQILFEDELVVVLGHVRARLQPQVAILRTQLQELRLKAVEVKRARRCMGRRGCSLQRIVLPPLGLQLEFKLLASGHCRGERSVSG